MVEAPSAAPTRSVCVVRHGLVGAAVVGVDVHVGVVEVLHAVEQPVSDLLGDGVGLPHGEAAGYGDVDVGDQTVAEPAPCIGLATCTRVNYSVYINANMWAPTLAPARANVSVRVRV